MPAKTHPRYVLIVLGGLLAGLALAYALSLPRVELNAPGLRDASTSASLELHFSHPMWGASVESRFRVEPPLEGEFAWPDARTLLFQPGELLEADTQYWVGLAPGVRSQRGVVLPWGRRFAFSTGHPTLLYLTEHPDGQVNLWRVEPDGSRPRQLTALSAGQNVHSFDVSPDGAQIVLSLERADGSAGLALLPRGGGRTELLLECPGSACINPAWSPDGQRIAYEQRTLVTSAIGPSLLTGQVWVLDMTSRQAEPVVVREVQQGSGPRWSPDGASLAFYDGSLGAIAVYDFSSDLLRLVPNLAGGRVAWSPDGASIVFAEMFLSDEDAALLAGHAAEHDPNRPHEEPQPSAAYQHLVRVDFEADNMHDLSGVLAVEDGTPVFSPDGRWLAFGRRALEGEGATLGRQLWLYDLQNDELMPLLDEPTYNHGAFSWSPDSSRLAYMRFYLLDPQAVADIWLVEVPGGKAHPVVEGAFLPAWLP